MPNFDPNNYIDVQDRINRFWFEYPEGAIVTEAPHTLSFDQVVMRALVYKHRDHERASATGYAAEERGKDYKAGANFTSWHENAETSAIGRALANMGYATSREDRPSKQEMAKAKTARPIKPEHADELSQAERHIAARDAVNGQHLQSPMSQPGKPTHGTTKATATQIQMLHGEGKGRGLEHDDLHALAGLKGYASIAEMTGDQILTMTTWLKSVRPAELDVYLKRAGRPTIDERLASAK